MQAFLKFHFLFLRVTQNRSFPPPLPPDEESECFNLAKKGNREARKKLIEHNLRLVSHIVKKYYTQSLKLVLKSLFISSILQLAILFVIYETISFNPSFSITKILGILLFKILISKSLMWQKVDF